MWQNIIKNNCVASVQTPPAVDLLFEYHLSKIAVKEKLALNIELFIFMFWVRTRVWRYESIKHPLMLKLSNNTDSYVNKNKLYYKLPNWLCLLFDCRSEPSRRDSMSPSFLRPKERDGDSDLSLHWWNWLRAGRRRPERASEVKGEVVWILMNSAVYSCNMFFT